MIAKLLREIHQINQGHSAALDKELIALIATIEKDGIEHIKPSAYRSIRKLRQTLTSDLADKQRTVTDYSKQLFALQSILPDEILPQPLPKENQPTTTASLCRQLLLVLESYRVVIKSLECNIHKGNALFEQNKRTFSEIYLDIHVNIAHQPLLQKLKEELKDSVDSDAILRNSKELIALLIKNINSEKETSQYFLKALNDALLNVKSIVDDGVLNNDHGLERRGVWDTNLCDNVNTIKLAVDSENEPKSFKQIISQEIDDILKAMTYKQEFDQQEHLRLASQFNLMQKQLALVEDQANQYKSQLDEQKQLNLQDPLTKLPNRAALDQRFSSEFQNAKTFDKPLWVVVADIDHFKRINDTFGHNAGDKTLQVISSAISRSLRGSEFIARYGGEEFVFLIPMATKPMLMSILNRVKDNVRSIPFKFKQEKVNITISLGATKVKLEDQDTETVFERADKALYKAKSDGRNRIVIG